MDTFRESPAKPFIGIPIGVYNYNPDGFSKRNSSQSSWAFCIINTMKDFVFATISVVSSIISQCSEVRAIEKGIEYYVRNQLLYLIIEIDLL